MILWRSLQTLGLALIILGGLLMAGAFRADAGTGADSGSESIHVAITHDVPAPGWGLLSAIAGGILVLVARIQIEKRRESP